MATQRDPLMWAVVLIAVIAVGLGAVSFGRNTTIAVNSVPSTRTISVRGTSTLDVKPDTANITLGLRVERPTAKEAQAAGAESLDKVIAALRATGIQDPDIRTTRVNLNPVYDYRSAPRLVGYASELLVTVTTRNLGDCGKIIDEAVKAGANQVENVAFSIRDTQKATQQAVDMAIDDARNKAEQVAAKAGQEIAGVQSLSVQELGGEDPRPIYMRQAAKMADSASLPVMPGTLRFTVAVDAVYIIK
ncbi:MAG: SIMPL domain-containing protein [Ignavibacteriales bacterium]